MNKLEELKEKLSGINRIAKCECNKLMRDYAMSNARFEVGDILQGSTSSILVTQIKWGSTRWFASNEVNPYVCYYGKILTKKLIPRKDGDTTTLYDYDELTKIN